MSRLKKQAIIDRIGIRAASVGLITALLIIAVTWTIDSFARQEYFRRAQHTTTTFAYTLREHIVGELTIHLASVQTLAAAWRAYPDGLGDRFADYANAMLASHPHEARILQLAPNGIITYVFPNGNNEANIGFDILAQNYEGPTAQRTIETEELVVAGPVNLSQGKRGLIARLPFFSSQNGSREFSGFATAVIDFDSLMEGFNDLISTSGYLVAIRGRDGLGKDGGVFIGQEELFVSDAILIDVPVSTGSWQLAILPKGGWPSTAPMSSWIWLFGIAVAILASSLIHLQVLTNERLGLARKKAMEASKAKTLFLASMSHELRTPMNAIIGFGEMLDHGIKGPLSEGQKEYLSYIQVSSSHLLELIDQVLEFSKIESGKAKLNLESINISEGIADAISFIANQAQKKKIDITIKNDCPTTSEVWSDPLQFRQVLINLLTNAVKYNHEGGSIYVCCSDAGNEMVRLTITDAGIGIPAEMQESVFEPFNRLGHESSNIEGTGIGLTITKKMVELMDGRIGFESKEEAGSSFWIELPRFPLSGGNGEQAM